MAKTILITDIDNTIYNFVDFFGPAFRSIVHVSAKYSNIPEESIYNDLRRVLRVYGSLEHKDLIRHLRYNGHIDDKQKERIIVACRRAFDQSRKKRLRLYDGMREVLHELKRRNVYIVGLTNAPLYQVLRRLRNDLRVLEFFDGVIAFEGTEQRTDMSFKVSFEREFSLARRKLDFVVGLPYERLKPNISAFDEVLSRCGDEKASVYCLGDSKHKDLRPGMELGAKGIWAKYGLDVGEENRDTLLRVSPWADTEQKYVGDGASDPVDFVVEAPTEILGIIEGSQMRLW